MLTPFSAAMSFSRRRKEGSRSRVSRFPFGSTAYASPAQCSQGKSTLNTETYVMQVCEQDGQQVGVTTPGCYSLPGLQQSH